MEVMAAADTDSSIPLDYCTYVGVAVASLSILTCQRVCVPTPTLTLASLCGAVCQQHSCVLHWSRPLVLHTCRHTHGQTE